MPYSLPGKHWCGVVETKVSFAAARKLQWFVIRELLKLGTGRVETEHTAPQKLQTK